MGRVKIKEALKFHNDNIRRPNENRFLSKALALKVIDKEVSDDQKARYLSQYNTGYLKCPSNVLKRLSEELQVSADFLLGLSEEPLGEKREINLTIS